MSIKGVLFLLVSVILVAIFCWFIISAAYGASWTPVKESPLYNSPQQEIKVAYLVIPLVSLGLSILIHCFVMMKTIFFFIKRMDEKAREISMRREARLQR